MFSLGLHVVAVRALDRRDGRSSSRRSSRRSGRRSTRRTSRRCRPATRSARRPRGSRCTYEIKPAKLTPGTYRNITGNQALSLGLVAAAKLSGLPLFLGAYPITPASAILEELAGYKNFGVRTFQAEDEIAAAGAAVGASFGGALGITTSAGPGVVLKAETVGLAIMLELPLVIVDVQRAGPSTGMPTKPEQGDLLMVMYGRNGESPVPVVAASSPSDCFNAAIEACRIALKYRTPVYLLSDAYLANGSEPWLLPELDTLPDLTPTFATEPNNGDEFLPYLRDPETLARPWAVPGTPGLEHRIGGIEKADRTREHLVRPRQPRPHDAPARAEGRGHRGRHPRARGRRPRRRRDDARARLGRNVRPDRRRRPPRARRGPQGRARASRYLNPFPRNTGEVVRRYEKVLIPEMNMGQLLQLIRAQFLVDAHRLQPHPRRAAARGRDRRGNRGARMSELTAKDFRTDQEVRWCPGCGDYAILAAIQSFMPELGIARENTVFVSGIGCASRFPYYMNTYGMHSIHGRAPAIATGLATSRPDLSVWVVSGDGDALSIGGNHLIHALRRNVNLKILLFNNRIYGLTKGQYSPTSEVGTVAKSTPMGSIDWPFNPVSLAVGAEATFVGRAIDTDKKGMTEVLRAAAEHRGSAFVEILQNCPIFNDDAWTFVRDDKEGVNRIFLRQGEPITWGKDGEKALRQLPDGTIEVCAASDDGVLVHDATHTEPSFAFALSRVTQGTHGGTPVGVFRNVSRPVYDDLMAEQLETAVQKRGEGQARRRRSRGATPLRRDLGRRLATFVAFFLDFANRSAKDAVVRFAVARGFLLVVLRLVAMLGGSVAPALADSVTQLPSGMNEPRMTVDSVGQHVFVSSGPGGSSIVVLNFDGTIASTITGEEGASEMALDSATHTLYVALYDASAISEIDTQT